MSAEVTDLTEHVSEEHCQLFDAWRDASLRAQESMNIRDALAAGKAWGRFMRSFERPAAISPNVVPFRPRRATP